MNYLEDKLEELDFYFKQKKESEKWLIILLFAGIVVFLVYSYFYPYAVRIYENSIERENTLVTSIQESNQYLESISRGDDENYTLNFYSNEIKLTKENIEEYRHKVATIDGSMQKLDTLLFNEKNWSIFLNSITDRATNSDVKILTLSNEYVDKNGSFGHVLKIDINCQGSFAGIMNFMHDMEQNILITDVYKSKIYFDKNQSKIMSDINISVWGINH